MNFTEYVLSKVAEEAIELAKEVLKGQQHGLESVHRNLANIDYIRGEFIDLLARAEVLSKCSEVIKKHGTEFSLFPARLDTSEYTMLEADISVAKMCHYALLDYNEGRLQPTSDELEYIHRQAAFYKEYLEINSR